MNTAIIMDIDGTLANAEHRLHLLPIQGNMDKLDGQDITKDEAWVRFLDAAADDVPNPEIVALNNAMHEKGHSVLIVTGRNAGNREVTRDWLAKHRIIYNRLYMRPLGDLRTDNAVKREILTGIRAEGYDVLFAVEDRARVAKMWRDEGIRCLHVCEGNY